MKAKFSAGIIGLIILFVFSSNAFAWNQPPVANLTASPTVCLVNETVTFSRAGSYDPDGSIVEYAIKFTSQGSYQVFTTETIEHQYSSPGTYTATLRVKDNATPAAYGYDSCTIYVYERGSTEIFVDESATGIGTGEDWDNAYTELSAAIAAAEEGGATIYVAQGTYKPGANQSDSFQLKYYMTIQGGYQTGGSAGPDPALYPTYLSGDLGGNDGVNFTNRSDNSYHVLKGNKGAIVDGFIVKGGYTQDGEIYGGGMYNENCDPIEVKNCTFEDNHAQYGGAIFNVSQYNESTPDLICKPTISGCIFKNNSAELGGAIFNNSYYYDASATIQDCVFWQNEATEYGGGAIFNCFVDSELINCVFSGNTASSSASTPYGGAVYNYYLTMTLTNCTFSNNTAEGEYGRGGGIYNVWDEEYSDDFNLIIKNSIFWGNTDTDGQQDESAQINDTVSNHTTVTYSCIQGFSTLGGIGNFGNNPQFVDADGIDDILGTEDDNLRLQSTSSCINKGKPDDYYDNQTDLDGNRRVMGARIDMGAYEFEQTRIYVDIAASPGGDGRSWSTSYDDFQFVLGNAYSGDQIWVADGIYKPTVDTDRSKSFVLQPGIVLYGGFNGNETELDERDWYSNKTILSGDLGDNDKPDFVNREDNSYHVLQSNMQGNKGAIIDGFIVKGGYSQSYYGGGMYNEDCGPIEIKNCIFEDNCAEKGGAICNISQCAPTTTCKPIITNCQFINNSAQAGGAIFNSSFFASATTTIQNCIFWQNKATEYGGGAIANYHVDSYLINCVFNNNTVSSSASAPYGGAIYNNYLTMTLTNCTFSDNTAEGTNGRGGGLYNDGGCADVTNCIFWGNKDTGDQQDESAQIHIDSGTAPVDYSCIQGFSTLGGIGNFGDNPQFVDVDGIDDILGTEDDNLRLQSSSPCINKGNPDDNYDNQTDLDGNRRVRGARVDMGAYEFEQMRIYVDITASPGGDGRSWDTSFNDLQFVLRNTYSGDQIWVADGIYKPTTDTDRSKSFVLQPGVVLYGGFNGDETELDERDWYSNKTILSGDIDSDDVSVPDNGNSYHVVVGADKAIIDGFIIKGGYSHPDGQINGGGMFNEGVSPIVRNCMFLGNYANLGGGIFNDDASPQIINCIFSGNYGDKFGGGIFNFHTSVPSIVNCTFSKNETLNAGGGICSVNYSTPAIINCIIWGNLANSNNSIYSGRPDETYISYSDIEGCGGSGDWDDSFGHDGGNNIDSDPLFVNAIGPDTFVGTLDDNLQLQSGSPCKETGLGGEDMGVNWPVDSVIQKSVSTIYPKDLAVNSNGLLYVLTYDNSINYNQVKIYNEQLQLQDSITITVPGIIPSGIDVDAEDNIYVADPAGSRILKYTSAGVLDTTFDGDGIVGSYGTGDGQFINPLGIAVGWDGNVYVTDSGNDRVQVFDENGQFVTKWGQFGSEPGQLNCPVGFCFLGNSKMVLADAGNNRIQHFSANLGYLFESIGQYGSHCGQFSAPWDVCYDINYDQLIVADKDNDRLQIFQMNNFFDFARGGIEFVKKIDNIGLSGPKAVVCAGSEAEQIIYVADTGNDRVLKIVVKHDQPGCTPLYTFESFKAALWAGDIQKVKRFFAEIVSEDYGIVLEYIPSKFKDMVSDMYGLVLMHKGPSAAFYYLLCEETGVIFGYPIIIIKENNNIWKIYGF